MRLPSTESSNGLALYQFMRKLSLFIPNYFPHFYCIFYTEFLRYIPFALCRIIFYIRNQNLFMHQKQYSRVLLVGGWIMANGFSGCASIELSDVPKKSLPPHPPQLTELQLELPSEDGPRHPVDTIAPTTLSGPGPEIIIIETNASALRAVAEQNAAVIEQLGSRFAFISAEEVPAEQCLIAKPSEEPETSGQRKLSAVPDAALYPLTYYSYPHNVAVHICQNPHQVVSVQRDPREGYQPEEGEEEIRAAIDLARSDQRIAREVQNLHGHAILTSPEEYRYFWVRDEAGFGHRVFWVTFSEMPESLALYFARVDLTSQTVLEAGKEPGPQ
jgi:hypothetical protein